MPLLDIATAQASLQNHLSPLRVQSLIHCKVFSSSFPFGDEKRAVSIWKSSHFPKKDRTTLQIRAIATFAPKVVVHKGDGHTNNENSRREVNSEASVVQAESSSVNEDVDEKEKLRRMRISKANKGNTPWNKGRKHSPETLQRIRERTKLAMQNPKIKMKLANLGHPQSKETRSKIGIGVRMRWKKRHEQMIVQESCYFEWQNLIAEASRRGYVGEEEMEWDSYNILSEKIEVEWVESVEKRKTMPRPKGSKRALKSPEQRRKIAEAIAAKWADPDYRERVCSALSKYHGTPVGAERKPRRRPSSQSRKQDPAKRRRDRNDLTGDDSTSPIQRIRLRRNKAPVYKDPLASSKLEMIKNIRSQRAAAETKKTEAIERARLLIAEAEKAAKALEIAAAKSPIAQASLMETRKLIAEAIQSIESIDTTHITSKNDMKTSLVASEMVDRVEKDTGSDNGSISHAELKEANGTKILASSKDEDLNFTNLSLHDILNGDGELLPTSSSGYSLPPIHLQGLTEESSSTERNDQLELNGSVTKENNHLPNGCMVQHVNGDVPNKSILSTKKWVRGKLVEVIEGD